MLFPLLKQICKGSRNNVLCMGAKGKPWLLRGGSSSSGVAVMAIMQVMLTAASRSHSPS